PEELKLELADKWIYSRLNQVIAEVEENYEKLRFNDSASILMDFVWKEFCSWYLELSKDRIYSDDSEAQKTAKYVLLDVLQTSMRLLSPIMPFISEEIWQNIKTHFPMDEDALVIAKFPESNKELIDMKIAEEMGMIQEAISAIRNLRKQVNLSPALEINAFIKVANEAQIKLFEDYSNYFLKLSKVSDINIAIEMEKPKASIAAVVQNIEIFLPLAGLIDLDAEREKLNKQIVKVEKEVKRVNGKLNNERFISKAPEAVINKEKAIYEEVKTKLDKLVNILNGLS
ncbi:MAG: class I tRNA ligase family protein, partial [Candidatus Cloacimonetes bacterium]|nr:class I tRNA ligase family protein [Candidatus Cloacimonadota bacterium]